MEQNYLRLIKKLKAYRISQFKTQEDVALESGLSKRTIVNLEKGENVSMENFWKYLDVLGLTQAFVCFPPFADMRFEDIPKNKYERQRVRERKTDFHWGDEE